MMQHVIGWTGIDAEPAPGGLTKKRIDLPGMSLVAVTVPGGTRGTRHSHDHDQFVQVVSGTGTLTKTVEALQKNGAGDVYACASHAVLSGPAVERCGSF